MMLYQRKLLSMNNLNEEIALAHSIKWSLVCWMLTIVDNHNNVMTQLMKKAYRFNVQLTQNNVLEALL